MADLYQTGSIATMHRLGDFQDELIERELEHYARIRPIALVLPCLASEMDRLKKEGFTILNETPKKGADNKLICFLHPKSSNGVLIELCQSIL